MLAPIVSGDEITETIPTGGEQDYEIVLAAGERVVLQAGITSGSGEVELQILDPSGEDITSNFLFPSSRIKTAFTAEAAGEYTLRVGDEGRNESLPFRMRVVALPGVDTLLTGRDIVPLSGQSFAATLAEHSFNVHTVNLDAGDWARVSGKNASPDFPEVNSVIDIEVYDPAGVRIATVSNFIQSLDFTAQESGEYTIIVYDEENLYELDYELRYVHLPGNPIIEPGSDGDLMSGQIQLLEVPEGGFGVNRFTAPGAGETYRVHAAKRTGQGSTELAVIGPDGAVVASDFDFPAAAATITTTAAGPHWVVVWDDTNDDRMEYLIRLGKLSGDPLPYVVEYDTPLTLGQEIFAEEGVVYPLFNLHPLTLQASQEVDLTLYDIVGGFSTPRSELTVHAPDGSVVATASSFTDQVDSSFTATATGTYTVVVSESGNDAPIIRYRLLAEEASPPVPGDYTGDGLVDPADYDAWSAALGATDGPALATDGNNDGVVNAADFTVWRENYVPPLRGDYNNDSEIDGLDYAAWRDGYGESGADLAADGNNDGVVNAADFTVWRENYVPPLRGDYNNDSEIDGLDYAAWRDGYGESGADLAADGNDDGVVNAADFTVWRENLPSLVVAAGVGQGSVHIGGNPAGQIGDTDATDVFADLYFAGSARSATALPAHFGASVVLDGSIAAAVDASLLLALEVDQLRLVANLDDGHGWSDLDDAFADQSHSNSDVEPLVTSLRELL